MNTKPEDHRERWKALVEEVLPIVQRHTVKQIRNHARHSHLTSSIPNTVRKPSARPNCRVCGNPLQSIECRKWKGGEA